MGFENRTIEISAGTIAKTIILLVVFWLVYLLRDSVLAVVAAIVIASAIDPGVRWFERRKVPRVVGVIAIYLAGFALVGFILFFIIPTFLSETSNLVSNIPTYINQINNAIPLLDQSILEGYAPIIKQVADTISHASYVQNLTSGGVTAANVPIDSARVFQGVISFILIVVLSFYFSVTRDGITHFLRIVTPIKSEEYVISLWTRTKNKIGAWMQGQIFLGALVGSIIYLLLSVLHVKHALPLGFLAGVLEIIPVFGPTLAAVPAVMFALLDGGAGLGFAVLLVYVIVQQFENHIFYPLVVRKMVGIPPILVIISLVVGYELAGFLGILLSVPLSVLLVEVVEDLDKKKALEKSK
jgi:predicted PurR-regulated permease PerM